jgi:hypothetical protein
VLGRRLAKLATDLTTTFERLRDDWPDESGEGEDVAEYWRNGLTEVRHGVIKCRRMWEECRTFIAGDEGRRLPRLAHRQLEESIKQFDAAIGLGKRETLAAFQALQKPYEPTLRASLYDRAVDQLAELSQRCTGLATQMHGEQGLATGSRPAPDGDDP